MVVNANFRVRILSEKAGEWNDDVEVSRDETSVEISKSQERLYIVDISGFRPVKNHLDLALVHP